MRYPHRSCVLPRLLPLVYPGAYLLHRHWTKTTTGAVYRRFRFDNPYYPSWMDIVVEWHRHHLLKSPSCTKPRYGIVVRTSPRPMQLASPPSFFNRSFNSFKKLRIISCRKEDAGRMLLFCGRAAVAAEVLLSYFPIYDWLKAKKQTKKTYRRSPGTSPVTLL